MGGDAWAVRLSAAAEDDFQQILRWTSVQFGPAQARAYADTVSLALKALCAGPVIAGARERPEIGPGLWTQHVARNGRKGHHFIVVRVAEVRDRQVLDVLRILHDALDLQRHLAPTNRL